MIICGIIEYFTSFIMEKLFNARWWDYSSRKFNINGRICLETLIPFGIAGVITLCIFNPIFIGLIEKIPDLIRHIISVFLLICFTTDTIVSIVIVAGLKSTSTDLSEADDTENISSYVHDQAENMAMQFESDVRKTTRKRKLRRQRKILHLKLRVNKKLDKEFKETIKRTEEFKNKISDNLNRKLENTKHSTEQLTNELKTRFAKKSFLHKRLMDAFPTFEVNEKWKKKYDTKRENK